MQWNFSKPARYRTEKFGQFEKVARLPRFFTEKIQGIYNCGQFTEFGQFYEGQV